MRPKDFWRMHPQEFWWLLEVKQPPKMYGSMTEAEVAELYEFAFGDDAQD
jgi:hypothetical protein